MSTSWSQNDCDARQGMADAPRYNGAAQPYRKPVDRGASRETGNTSRDQNPVGYAESFEVRAEGFLRLEAPDGFNAGTVAADVLPRKHWDTRMERGHQGRSAVKWWLDVTNIFLLGLVAAPLIFLAIVWMIGR